MPLVVPEPWSCVCDGDARVRHRLTWTRHPGSSGVSIVGVVMYNPGWEGQRLPDGRTLDGATHRRVRALLGDATEIRVANLSPVRETKPALARRACQARPWSGDLEPEQASALAWVCAAPLVVVGWGAGSLTPRMEASRGRVLDLCAGRLWCWGTTPAGHPLHPSPLGRVEADAALVRF